LELPAKPITVTLPAGSRCDTWHREQVPTNVTCAILDTQWLDAPRRRQRLPLPPHSPSRILHLDDQSRAHAAEFPKDVPLQPRRAVGSASGRCWGGNPRGRRDPMSTLRRICLEPYRSRTRAAFAPPDYAHTCLDRVPAEDAIPAVRPARRSRWVDAVGSRGSAVTFPGTNEPALASAGWQWRTRFPRELRR
jgi:hypothetical protein